MQQILFHLPDWLPFGLGHMPVYGYGVMMVLGFFAALQLAKFLARRSGINPDVFVNAGLIALVSGVIGARLSHVLENFSHYSDAGRTFAENFRDAANIRSGGLTFYGGFLFATPCTIAYGLWRGVPIRLGMDIVAPCLMIGLGFGRIGCFLNGCCYGTECNLPAPLSATFPYHSNAYVEQHQKGEIQVPPRLTGITTDGKEVLKKPEDVQRDPELAALARKEHARPVHNAQLYSTVTAWLIAGVLVAAYTLRHVPGRVFALMLMIEAPARFVLEMLRAEPTVLGPMSFSMVLSIGLLIAGVILWFVFGKMGGEFGGMEPTPAAAPANTAAS